MTQHKPAKPPAEMTAEAFRRKILASSTDVSGLPAWERQALSGYRIGPDDAMEQRCSHPLYGWVDEACIPLCDAINRLDGLATSWSCCGHGKRGYMIGIQTQNPDCFAPLVYILGRLKQAGDIDLQSRWRVTLATKALEGGVGFMLTSESVGRRALSESRLIATVIHKHLEPTGTDPAFDKAWNLHRTLGDVLKPSPQERDE